MSRLGEILAELREDKGLKQKQLADELHISSSSISAFETGYRLPNIETLSLLAKYFDVTLDYLVGLTDFSLSPSVLSETFVDDINIADAVKMLKELLPEQRRAVLLILKDMTFSAELAQKTTPHGASKK